MQAVIKKLGINPGETTADYEFTLERVACLGSCALAPVMVIDDKVHGLMTTAKTKELLDRLDSSNSPEEATSHDGYGTEE